MAEYTRDDIEQKIASLERSDHESSRTLGAKMREEYADILAGDEVATKSAGIDNGLSRVITSPEEHAAFLRELKETVDAANALPGDEEVEGTE